MRTPSKKPDLPKESGGSTGLMDNGDFFGGAVFGVGEMAPGLLPRLATGCGEAIVAAFKPFKREYTGFGAGCWLLLGSAMGPGCAC